MRSSKKSGSTWLFLLAAAVLIIAAAVIIDKQTSDVLPPDESKESRELSTAIDNARDEGQTPDNEPVFLTGESLFRKDKGSSKGQDITILNIKNICQNTPPALPTGCEVTSLAAVLNFYGFDVSKNELSEKYLEKGDIILSDGVMTAPDPDESFVGDPEYPDSYGCYSSVIESCANSYLEDKGAALRARAFKDTDFEFFLDKVMDGEPVLVWTTISLKASYISSQWLTPDGREVYWLAGEHCMVLAGYDEKRDLVYCCDPLRDTEELCAFDRELFKQRFYEQGAQGVIFE